MENKEIQHLAEKIVDYLYDPQDVKHNFGIKITKTGISISWPDLKRTIGRDQDWDESIGGQLTDFFTTVLTKPRIRDLDQNCCKDIRRWCHCSWWQNVSEEEKKKLRKQFTYTNKTGNF